VTVATVALHADIQNVDQKRGALHFIFGIVLSAMGVPVKTIQLVTGSIGGIIGLAISIFPMKMILGSMHLV
jgi:hypothetical protein